MGAPRPTLDEKNHHCLNPDCDAELQLPKRTTQCSDQLKRLIDSEVPVGSTQSQVLAFLDNHDWKYTDQTESQQAIFATLLDPSNEIVRKRFQIAFYLDDHGKLRSYTIKEFLVGP